MIKAKDTEQKEEQIMDLVMEISNWWHKWEENRDGKRVTCIEYARSFDKERDGISADGEVT